MADQPNDPTDHNQALDDDVDQAADASPEATAEPDAPTETADAPYRRQPVTTTGANLGWVIGYLLVFATLVAVGLAIHYRDAAASTPPHPCSEIDFDNPTPSRRQRALVSDCCADGYSRAWQLCAPHCPDLRPNDPAGQRACCRDSNDRWDYCNLPCEPWPNEDGLFADQCCRNATGDWEPCPVPCDDLWYDDEGLFDAEEEFTRRRPAWCD